MWLDAPEFRGKGGQETERSTGDRAQEDREQLERKEPRDRDSPGGP